MLTNAPELTETLSKLAVTKLVVEPLDTARPMKTFWAMVIVWLVLICVQSTPFDEVYPLKVLPLRTSFIQVGIVAEDPKKYPVLAPVLKRSNKYITFGS